MTYAGAMQWQHPDVAPVDRTHEAALRGRIDGKAKPPGSLGRIEALALQLGLIAFPTEPRADDAVLLVFAGDHGMTASGVSQYPSDVTAALVVMVRVGDNSKGECMGLMPFPVADPRVAQALAVVALAHLDACGVLDAAVEQYGQMRELRELDGEPVKH